MSAHVEVPSVVEWSPGRFTVELVFPAGSKGRAQQHHDVAWALAGVHGVEASTPWRVNPRWSVYEENWGNGERYGWQDVRRLSVVGSARALAGYLVALERVLGEVEALATRAVRVFGQWRRSIAAEAFLEWEDASTMRTRGRVFRADVLRALVRGLGAGERGVAARDASRPLWEQYEAVAGEVWAEGGGVDLVAVDERLVAAWLLRMLPEAGRQAVEEAERVVSVEAGRVGAERPFVGAQLELFPEVERSGRHGGAAVVVWPVVTAGRRVFASAA